MDILNYGKVLVIDDKEDEAQPLLDFLKKEQIFSINFVGVNPNYSNKVEDVGLIFLDFMLTDDIMLNDEKNISSYIINIFDKIIYKKNKPFFIIGWTKHSEISDRLYSDLKKNKYRIIKIIDLGKSEFLKNTDEKKLEMISSNMERIFKSELFLLIYYWNRCINNHSEKIINQIYDATNDNEKLPILINMFSEAEKRNCQEDEKTMYFYKCLNRIFLENLNESMDTKIGLEKFSGSILATQEKSSFKDKVKYNTILQIDTNQNDSITPGAFIKVDNSIIKEYIDIEKLYKQLLSNIKEKYKEKFENGCKKSDSYICEITPECDFMEDKKIFLKKFVYCKLMCIEAENEKIDFFNVCLSQYIKKSEIVEYDNKQYLILIFLNSVVTLSLEQVQALKPLFRIKRELLNDIRSNVANHLNRPGHITLI